MVILIVMNLTNMSDSAILEELGMRLRSARLDANMTREALASKIDLSVDTVRNAETGRNVSLETLIRLLRGLGRLADLQTVLEDAGPSPVQLAKSRGRVRQRASGSRRKSTSGEWQW
jgi:transcriptional regulator with XRE-family HTH domain